MVRALENLHGALRPQGVLLDVRPAQRHPWVELRCVNAADQTERWVRLGQVDDSYRHGTLVTADAALLTVIAAGRFIQERAETFTFIYHFDSAQAWLAHMAEHWSTAHLSPDLLTRVREERLEEAGAVRVLRVIRAQLLRRG